VGRTSAFCRRVSPAHSPLAGAVSFSNFVRDPSRASPTVFLLNALSLPWVFLFPFQFSLSYYGLRVRPSATFYFLARVLASNWADDTREILRRVRQRLTDRRG